MHQATSSQDSLKADFVGKRLDQLPTPAAVLDRAIIKRNCDRMLEACSHLGVLFRPHIKTHKTVEITRLQVGIDNQNVDIIVSTVHEAEYVVGYLKECQKAGKTTNVLYGVPLPPSQARRLGYLGRELGPGSVSIMIDHVEQLSALHDFVTVAGFHADIFLKVDSGYGRAGLPPRSGPFIDLLERALKGEGDGTLGTLRGFYSHAGHSYAANSPLDAMKLLSEELEALVSAASVAKSLLASQYPELARPRFVLSMGASPSATSTQYLDHSGPQPDSMELEGTMLRNSIKNAQVLHHVELHAGVYPIMDMQQLAAHSASYTLYGDPALSILVEVASLYEHRKPREALIAAGSLALGREPCRTYEGWGVVSPWNMPTASSMNSPGWNVARISQEHGILQPSPSLHVDPPGLSIGQKLRIWPNHACIAGAGYAFYVVIDTDLPGDRRDVVVDIWMRCQGW